jgi:hypothetical protein
MWKQPPAAVHRAKLDGSFAAGEDQPVGDPYTLVICCALAGAISCNGSSGITIQATR